MIKLTPDNLRAILPRAPQAVIDAFVAKQDLLTKAGINASRARMTFFWANVEHESGGFSISNLTEDVRYTAARMAAVWPNRFPAGAADVRRKYGTGPGWQRKAFDDIYGRRMGNRPGTNDGSTYIGRGGPQWTGRDGYAALERLTGLPVVADPTIATRLDLQPEVCVAFWTWKNLNRFADAGDFVGCVKSWNGGTNGMADRKHRMAGNDPIIARMETVNSIAPSVPEPMKPKVTKEDVVKGAVVAGETSGVAYGVDQGWGWLEWSMFGIGSALVVAAACLAYRFLWPRVVAWWRARQVVTTTAQPAAAPVVREIAKASKTRARKPTARRKPAVKPAAKKMPARKPAKRKAA